MQVIMTRFYSSQLLLIVSNSFLPGSVLLTSRIRIHNFYQCNVKVLFFKSHQQNSTYHGEKYAIEIVFKSWRSFQIYQLICVVNLSQFYSKRARLAAPKGTLLGCALQLVDPKHSPRDLKTIATVLLFIVIFM